jgi:Sulfotransferase family
MSSLTGLDGTTVQNGRRKTPLPPGAAAEIPEPVFILAAPRSFSSVVCAMLGQHPQMYGLPETHLFSDETLAGWLDRSSQETYPMRHGLLRAVAQLCYGEQTEGTVRLAAAWIRRRSGSTSGMVFEELAGLAFPSVLVDKSPSIVYCPTSMERAFRFFPQARFIHLARHPRGQGHSVLKYLDAMAKWASEGRVEYGAVPDWLRNLATFTASSSASEDPPEADPQRAWYVLNENITTFLKSVPDYQWMTIRGEDLLAEPDRILRRIAGWLGLRTDPAAVEEMKHPERSRYACFGPRGARCGNDIFFLHNPVLHIPTRAAESLEGPVDWLHDGRGFLPEVREMARHLGYR